MSYISGIDVSSVQGSNINWNAVAASGIEFVIAKCYQGNSGADPYYSSNIAGATAAGLKTACYHFVYPLPTNAAEPNRDPIGQANLHFNASQGQIAFIDCEWPAPQDFLKWGITPAFVNTWVLAYLTEYSRLSAPRSPIVYTYPYWANYVKFDQSITQYPLWIASYVPTPAIPAPWSDWVVWQTTGGGGHLPSGAPVDTDVVKDLSLWESAVITPTSAVDPVVNEPNPPAPIIIPTPNTVVSPNTSNNIFSYIINFFLNLFK